MSKEQNPPSENPNVCAACLRMVEELAEYIPAHELAYFKKGVPVIVLQKPADSLNAS